VPLDGVEPTLANVESGAYRFTKHLYFIVPRASSAEAQRFMDFLQSPQGIKVLRASETLPVAE
jgi:phosphate transport system substrate-binding protein